MRNIIFATVLIAILTVGLSSTMASDLVETAGQFEAHVIQPASDLQQQTSIESATLFTTDFESGFPTNIVIWAPTWYVTQDSPGNSAFCNHADSDWGTLHFGSDDWENYAISLRVKFLTTNPGQWGELYSRINQTNDGYRATLWTDDWASINYYPPPVLAAGTALTIDPNTWYQIEVDAVGSTITYFIDGQQVVQANDDRRSSGRAGFGASPGTELCIDDIVVWGLDANGSPVENPAGSESGSLLQYQGDCAFCFLIGDPRAPVWSAERQGYIPSAQDTREQIVLDENFSVPAGEEVVFKNQIVWIRPQQRKDIDIYGKLIIQNSILLWDQTQHQQTRLNIQSGAELRIEDSFAFGANHYWLAWAYEDGSTVYLDHFVGNAWTTIHGSVNYTAINYSTVKLTLFDDTDDTDVYISNAHHVWLEMYPPAGDYEMTLPEKRRWADWNVTGIWPGTEVRVFDSYIYDRDISLSDDTHITVSDTPSGFGLGWAIHKDTPGFVDCELSSLGDPNVDTGVFYQDMVWDLPCINSSLTIRDSLLQRAWPIVWGNVHLRITDSNLVDPRNYGGPATIEISDSSIDHVASYAGGVIYLENVRIRYDIEVKGADSVVYGYQVAQRYDDWNMEIIQVEGGAYIELETLQKMYATATTDLRSCPDTTCEPVGSVVSGDVMRVIGSESGETIDGSDLWYQVALSGKPTYIHSSQVDAAQS